MSTDENYRFEIGQTVEVKDTHGYRPGQIFEILSRGKKRGTRWYSDGTDSSDPISGQPGVFEHALTLLDPVKPIGDPDDSPVEHPKHYNSHPSGVECIEIARHHNFNIGNVFKYLWRIGLKGEKAATKEQRLEEIDKAIFYLQDERARVEGEA